jgi:hypothetical protein
MLVLGALFVTIRGLTQQIDQPILQDRLLEEEERSGSPGFDRPVNGALTTDHDRLGLRIDLAEVLEELNAVDVGECETGQDDVGTPVPEEFFTGVAAERGSNVVAFRFKNLAKPVSGGWFFVNDEYAPTALAVQRHRFSVRGPVG